MLTGKRILVTGGSSGLGKAMAALFIERGAQVLITGRDESKLAKVAEELKCSYVTADVSSDDDISRTFDWIDTNWKGGLDVLINNAGIGSFSELDGLNRADFREVFEVNVYGAAMMAKEAVKRFKSEKIQGDIVNIASTASLKGFAKGSVYSASKFALRAMTQAWQAELRPFDIRVIQVNPSEVPTAFNSPERTERALQDKKLTPVEIAHTVLSTLEMDRRGFIPEVSVFATNPF